LSETYYQEKGWGGTAVKREEHAAIFVCTPKKKRKEKNRADRRAIRLRSDFPVVGGGGSRDCRLTSRTSVGKKKGSYNVLLEMRTEG